MVLKDFDLDSIIIIGSYLKVLVTGGHTRGKERNNQTAVYAICWMYTKRFQSVLNRSKYRDVSLKLIKNCWCWTECITQKHRSVQNKRLICRALFVH